MTPQALLHQARQQDIRYVQLCDNLPLHTLPAAQRNELQKLAQSEGIQIQTGTRRLSHENILQYLTIARQMQSPFLRVVIDDAGYYPEEAEVIEVIRRLLPSLREAQVVLAIENHDRFPVASLQRIIEATDTTWVGICLDTANSLGAGEGIREVTEILAPYTVNLHIKDFTIQRLSHKMGFHVAGCAAGQGMLDIPWLIDRLKSYGRCQTATLEVWSEPMDTLQDTLDRETRWVADSIHYLKPYLTIKL